MSKFSKVKRTRDFERDLKLLLKKYRTLEDDLTVFIETQLDLFHKKLIDNKGIFQLTGLPYRYPKIYKAKKFTCRSLKGTGVQSGIRIIYSYFQEEDMIELIEIYHKKKSPNEDKARIRKYLKDYNQE